MSFRVAVVAAAILLLPHPGSAQTELRGYALGVGSYVGESALVNGGSTLFGRARAMLTWDGSWLSAEVAYEHLLQRHPAGGGFGITSAGTPRGGTAWLPLDGTIHRSGRSSWRHQLDRMALRASRGPLEVTLGRQAISRATTLFLTPADPFSPFDPADPFREYRGGVDAARVRYFTGSFTELEAVVRPIDAGSETPITALARISTSRGGWAFGLWGGLLHEEPAGAAFVTGGLGATSLRTEFALREDPDGGALVRGSLGLDRFFQPGGRDLRAMVEVQYDGFGAASAEEIVLVSQSAAYRRGELQVIGAWTAAAQASWQLHPLVAIDALALTSLVDGSALLAPGLSWSTTASVSTRLGAFFGVGADAAAIGPVAVPGSEYGSVPPLVYLSLSFFF